MATTISLKPEKVGIFHVDNVSDESIRRTNQLLQRNHEEFHIMWEWERAGGLHNHQVHYLLSDLALGASPAQIQEAFDSNTNYMAPITKKAEATHPVTEENFASSLGDYRNYLVWMRYFQTEIDARGWRAVLAEYLFDRSPRANDLLGRMFEGAVHPIIHLGFGVEFEQPAIIAEALAQAAVHRLEATPFLLEVEKLSQASTDPSPSIVSLITSARSDPSIKNAECWSGHSFEMNGSFFATLPKNLVTLAAQYKIERSEAALTKAIAEMMNAVAWFNAAAQRPDKAVKFDFFYMHCVNCSIFLDVFAKFPELSLEDKIRLVEWKVRFDLVIYVCQGSPELLTDEISNYQVRRADSMNWEVIIDRAKNIPCDGHVVKMVRALRHAADCSAPFEGGEEFTIKEDMWLKIANMVLDSTEDYPSVRDKWTRGPGFDSCWEVVPPRKTIANGVH